MAVAECGEINARDGIGVGGNSCGGRNGVAVSIGDGDGDGLAVFYARGVARDGDVVIFCGIEETITTVIDGDVQGGSAGVFVGGICGIGG